MKEERHDEHREMRDERRDEHRDEHHDERRSLIFATFFLFYVGSKKTNIAQRR